MSVIQSPARVRNTLESGLQNPTLSSDNTPDEENLNETSENREQRVMGTCSRISKCFRRCSSCFLWIFPNAENSGDQYFRF